MTLSVLVEIQWKNQFITLYLSLYAKRTFCTLPFTPYPSWNEPNQKKYGNKYITLEMKTYYVYENSLRINWSNIALIHSTNTYEALLWINNYVRCYEEC